MKREDKNNISRQRILDAALREFSAKGYEGASLNTVWMENGISKGLIYHYFKDKDEIYLTCVKMCFDAITDYLARLTETFSGTAADRLSQYFEARLRFFTDNPLYLGIFSDTLFQSHTALAPEIVNRRQAFDALSSSILTDLLNTVPLRRGLTVEAVIRDFRMYVDFFNLRFRAEQRGEPCLENAFQEHEEICRRQVDILLHGVLSK